MTDDATRKFAISAEEIAAVFAKDSWGEWASKKVRLVLAFAIWVVLISGGLFAVTWSVRAAWRLAAL
jgi:hypothetical protein